MVKSNLKEVYPHKMPDDLKKRLQKDSKTLALWQSLTPLAKNEFLCWVESAKSESTRDRRITRVAEELNEGKRRPCCWYGCVHRLDKQLSKTQKWIINKRK